MTFLPDVVRVPGGKLSLRPVSDSCVVSEDGAEFALADGIFRFLPGEAPGGPREFYDKFGWQKNDKGEYCETVAFSDRSPISADFTSYCMLHLKNKYFRGGGKYLLDAGCGPMAHPELIGYSDAFERRVCLDVSGVALMQARDVIGERGVYLHASISEIPLASESMDAVMCYHVIYQLPPQQQVEALRELWRVLKPGGVGVFVYMWPKPPIPRYVGRLARAIGLKGQGASAALVEAPPSSHDQLQSRAWMESQELPFKIDYDVYRVVDNNFMRRHVSEGAGGRLLVRFLRSMQEVAPRFCGRHGSMPAFVVRK